MERKFKELSEMYDHGKSEVSDDSENDLPPPPTTPWELVHDQTNLELGKSENDKLLLSSWAQATEEKALKIPKCWTLKDSLGVNMLEQLCPHHTDEFLLKNKMLPDEFGGHIFPNYPVETYLSLWKRAKESKNRDFPYPEIRFCFENIRRHINRMEQRFCCGEYCHQTHPRFELVNEVFKLLLQNVAALEAANFPYAPAMRFLPKFIHVLEWVTFYAITLPEIYHYEIADALSLLDLISVKRGESKGREQRAKYRAQFEDYLSSVMTGNEKGIVEVFKTAMTTCRCDACIRISRTLAAREIILVPTYEELNFIYFSKVRPVPMFAIGLIDLPYLLADGFEYSPFHFFVHDLFHTIGNDDGKPQLWQTMEAKLKRSEAKQLPREKIFEIWNRNIQILLGAFNRAETKHEALALAIMLFIVLHEPAQDLKNDINFSPALPEPESIRSRLSDPLFMPKFKAKALDYFFGLLDPAVVDGLETAKEYMLETLKNLEQPQKK